MFMRRPYYLSLILLLVIVGSPLLPGPIVWAAPQSAGTLMRDPYGFFPETGHTIGGAIKQFYDANGGLPIFGLALTEVIVDARSGLQVQYFERARFELHPELPPASSV